MKATVLVSSRLAIIARMIEILEETREGRRANPAPFDAGTLVLTKDGEQHEWEGWRVMPLVDAYGLRGAAEFLRVDRDELEKAVNDYVPMMQTVSPLPSPVLDLSQHRYEQLHLIAVTEFERAREIAASAEMDYRESLDLFRYHCREAKAAVIRCYEEPRLIAYDKIRAAGSSNASQPRSPAKNELVYRVSRDRESTAAELWPQMLSLMHDAGLEPVDYYLEPLPGLVPAIGPEQSIGNSELIRYSVIRKDGSERISTYSLKTFRDDLRKARLGTLKRSQ